MKYYVYEHVRLDKNEPFYVGKGKNKRAYQKSGRNNYWKNIINITNYEVNILKEFDLEQEALDYEKEIQEIYEQKGYKLANLTKCGKKGPIGFKPNKNTREKLSIHSKKLWSDPIHKQKISERQKQLWSDSNYRNKMNKILNRIPDSTVFCFWNKDFGQIKCTRLDLSIMYKISKYVVRDIVREKTIEHKGWRLYKNKDREYRLYKEENIKYNWYNEIKGYSIVCNRIQLIKKFPEIRLNGLWKLVNKKAKTYLGWKIIF